MKSGRGETETRGHGDGRGGDAEKELIYAKHPRVAPSPRLRVFFFILHPSSFILGHRIADGLRNNTCD